MKGQDPVLTFWKAFGIYKEGNIPEAIRELNRVQDRREVSLAAAIALIHYHERCRNVDQEAIDTLTLEMDNREEMASDRDLSVAATFLWHCQ
jgi:tetratricopeptide repeat protein 21B